jgi:hypothetical protein
VSLSLAGCPARSDAAGLRVRRIDQCHTVSRRATVTASLSGKWGEAGPGRGDSAATRKERERADRVERYGTGSKEPGPGPAAVVQLHKLETRGTWQCSLPFPSVELPITLS